MSLLKVKDITQRTRLSRSTIRYYESLGLIHHHKRSQQGYKLYNEDTVHRLFSITTLKSLNFKLSEIKQIMHLLSNEIIPCDEIERYINSLLEDVNSKINSLNVIKTKLERFCPGCRSRYSKCDCPIVNNLLNPYRFD